MTRQTTGVEGERHVIEATPDRRALIEFLDAALITREPGERVGLLIMEIDGTTDVGDERPELLAHLAARGRRIVRGGDLFCALAGDVFGLAWKHADEAAQAGLVSRVVSAMRAPFVLTTCELYLDVVVGTALSDTTSTAETILARAERSLVVMKTARRYGLADDRVSGAHHARPAHHDDRSSPDGTSAPPPPVPKRVATLIVDLADGRIRHVDDPAQRLLSEPRARLVGNHVAKVLDPSSSAGIHLAVAALASGAVESFRGRCVIVRQGGALDAWASVRTVTVRDTRIAVWTILPDDDEHRPADVDAPFWHRQVELAVGLAGNDLVVSGAVPSVQRIEASDPRLCAAEVTRSLQEGGATLVSFVHADDAEAVRDAHAVALSGRHSTVTDVRWFHPEGGWFEAELILFATGSARAAESVGFVLAERRSAAVADDAEDRVMRLERLLAHIASEARAATKVALDETHDARSRIDWSRLDGMSNRQREVVKRLVMGERVPAIAKAMYISRSTVRNHLSSAFHLCGVSTQSDLIELFLSTASDRSAA